jgi:hypothetical protein
MRALICVLFLMTANPAGAIELRQADSSGNLSQFVRSNARHYWHYMRTEANLKPIQSYIPFEGVVAGDPHLGNFAPLPLAGQNGRRQMEFVNVDFDDAGRAPFVLDFVRYVIAVEATFPETKKRKLEEAYVKGLQGQAAKAPSSLDEITGVSVADYDKMVAEYLEKNTNGDAFKIREGKVEEYKGKIKRASIERAFPGVQVLDVALRPADRGGSAESLRLWVLVKEPGGLRRIMELKQYQSPGVGNYQKQPAVSAWLKQVRDVFWPELDASVYDLVEVDGLLFWKRPKGVSIVDVPYSSEKRKKMKFAADLAEYDANLLGLAHGRQRGCDLLLKAIQSDRGIFHEAVEEIVQDYLAIVKKAFNRR